MGIIIIFFWGVALIGLLLTISAFRELVKIKENNGKAKFKKILCLVVIIFGILIIKYGLNFSSSAISATGA